MWNSNRTVADLIFADGSQWDFTRWILQDKERLEDLSIQSGHSNTPTRSLQYI